MKKIVLSTLAALSIATVASASDVKLYQDANGQVFTTSAEGRTAIVDKSASINSLTDKLDFSMLVYAGFQNTDYRNNTLTGTSAATQKGDLNNFEIRRAYFQVKAHLLEDPKSYFRLTMDAGLASDGNYNMRIKYGYLFLNDVLPFTGVEAGIAHTTWLDYEENSAWLYRNILETFSEQKNAGGLQQSADAGVNFRTNTKYLSTEIGIFNGEGYHGLQPTSNVSGASHGMDYEARATVHALGVDHKDSKKTYWDISLLGKYNAKGNSATTYYTDTQYLGVHSVFNTEPLLIAAQYINSSDTDKTSTSGIGNVSAKAGSGYSVNFDARMGEKDQYHVFGRYDTWTQQQKTGTKEYAQRTYIGGVAYDMNKNVQLVANVITKDNESNQVAGSSNSNALNSNEYMLTAQVQF